MKKNFVKNEIENFNLETIIWKATSQRPTKWLVKYIIFSKPIYKLYHNYTEGFERESLIR